MSREMRLRSPSMAWARMWRSRNRFCKRLPEMADDALQPLQILREKPPVRVPQQKAADGLAAEVKRHAQNRAPAKFLPHGARQARQILQTAPILAIPAEAVASSFQLIPANAGVRLIEQEAVAAIHGKVFRRKARIVPGT